MTKGTAVITGAAAGIGQAYARRLASDGFDIAMADVSEASATRAIVEGLGRKFHASVVDVTSAEVTQRFAAEVAEALPITA